ncbi:(2Fe-2S)-binding protein [Bartonella sp. M0177]|uniref:(2Fe-2S)-binding protein n=1 Tax=Bartonella sp. M0177 TaxID=2750940 RepID=UPI0018DB5185|nr:MULTISPECIES: (2Fe-2S)-binding protein [Bartonella]MBI0003462.1 (2Fe-2S)-binding protein [Bartonella sp. M0177]WLT09400.1 (2Fe-2S)-binding protein [Bartonella apihabitans]
MIVCSCNVITQSEIEDVINSLLEEDCWQLIVPGKIYKVMAKRGKCCCCFPNILETIIRVSENFHRLHNRDEAEIISYLDRVRALRLKYRRIGQHERSRKGHRAA